MKYQKYTNIQHLLVVLMYNLFNFLVKYKNVAYRGTSVCAKILLNYDNWSSLALKSHILDFTLYVFFANCIKFKFGNKLNMLLNKVLNIQYYNL